MLSPCFSTPSYWLLVHVVSQQGCDTIPRCQAVCGLQAACSTEIVCAREDASGGGVLDKRGVLGFACSDGIPIMGMYMAMHTPEQFGYYTLGLHYLQQKRQVQLVGCDSSCKLQPHLRRLFPPGELSADLWQETEFVTGYMHGSTHIPRCILKFHGVFAEGFGRVVLEDMEHIFGEFKPCTKNFKYMAEGRFVDAYDDLLDYITERKVRLMPGSMDAVCICSAECIPV